MQRDIDLVESLLRSAGRRVEPPDGTYEQVLAAAQAAFRMKSSRRRERSRLLWAGAAAAVVVGVVFAWRLTLPVTPDGELARVARISGTVEVATGGAWQDLARSGVSLEAGVRIRTLDDGRAAFELAGGESLRLAAGTEIMLDAPGRLYLQSGTLYVDSGVQRAAARLEVVTPAGTARDIGTQFELKVAGSALRLRVREGRVALDRGGRTLTGQAGEQVSINGLDGVSRSPIAADDPAWQWAESIAPMPDMDGKPAAALIAWVARETGRRLRYESTLVEQRATAVILHGDVRHLAPIEALQVMLATTDLKVELRGDTMEVRTRGEEHPGL
jgi:ferric-dicitrate binding protein FerR (iron transport regulator)